MKVAFDVDGCLLGYDGALRDEVCKLLIAFLTSDFQVIVWSGGGDDYARAIYRRVVNQYKLIDRLGGQLVTSVICKAKDNSKPELAIDDQPVNLGHFNLCWAPWSKDEQD